MSGETRAGWPVRRFSPNGHSCLAGESGGVSWGAWFACCPQGTYPKGSREDRWCDGRNDAPGNSTSHPQCADSKWKLWTLDGRYFCCDDGKEDRGYYYTNSQYYYFGCASDDWIANTNASVRRAGSYPNPPGRYSLVPAPCQKDFCSWSKAANGFVKRQRAPQSPPRQTKAQLQVVWLEAFAEHS